MKYRKKKMLQAQLEMLAGIGMIILGLFLCIWIGKSQMQYMTASQKVSVTAYFDSEKSPEYFANAQEKGYKAHWYFELDGITYRFVSEEKYKPEEFESKKVKGYMDSAGEFQVISTDGFMGMAENMIWGPIIFLGGIATLVFAVLEYKKNKAEIDKQQAVIAERLETQKEYEKYVEQAAEKG